MRTLTKEAERKLIGAIEKAAALVNDGMSPNEAIIKSASEANVPAGHINLMVHAYNTGRTTKQRENGESTLEKAAEFPMADANEVLKALYPEQVKTSAEIATDSVVSTEYAISAAGMLSRRKDAMRKVAAAQVALPLAGYERPPRDEHAAVMRAQSEKIAAQRVEEEKRRVATAAYSKAASAMEDLNTYFRTPGNMSFGDAIREVNLRFGPPGVSVLEKVAAVYPHFTKQADTQKQHFGDNAVYGLVQNVLDSVSAYNDAQAQVSVKKSEAVSQTTAPQFLTGSILAEEQPLTLKDAMAAGDRHGLTDPPKNHQKGAPFLGNKGEEVDPTNFPHITLGPDDVLVYPDNYARTNRRGQPTDPIVVPRSALVSEAEIDARRAAASAARNSGGGGGGSGSPTPPTPPTPPSPPKPYILDDQTRHEDLARELGVSPSLNAAELRKEMQRTLTERNRAAQERESVDTEQYRLTGKPAPGSKEEAQAKAEEERARRAEQDENEDFYERQLRDIAEEEKAKERDALNEKRERNESEAYGEKIRHQWRDGLEKQKEKQKKERQEVWDAGKSVGADIGKAFKGDFIGNATKPIKAIAEAMGAKSVAEMAGLGPKDPAKILREQYQQLVDPSHENALKTIRAKGVLHDMILNDPVVSGYDPQDVAMAFNEIAELAPSLIDTPGVIRPLLRKRLEAGQLADFDVKQILEMDKLRGDRDKTLLDLKEKNLNLL